MEIWKDIIGWGKKYQASSFGNIRKITGKFITQSRHPSGYLYVTLYYQGVKTRRMIHRLIIETFARPFTGNECTHHINGNKQDNKLSNLEIMTVQNHAKLHSLLHNFSKNHGRTK